LKKAKSVNLDSISFMYRSMPRTTYRDQKHEEIKCLYSETTALTGKSNVSNQQEKEGDNAYLEVVV
jgi:hypothetical protein